MKPAFTSFAMALALTLSGTALPLSTPAAADDEVTINVTAKGYGYRAGYRHGRQDGYRRGYRHGRYDGRRTGPQRVVVVRPHHHHHYHHGRGAAAAAGFVIGTAVGAALD